MTYDDSPTSTPDDWKGGVLISFPALRETLPEFPGPPAWRLVPKVQHLTPKHLPQMLYHAEVVPRSAGTNPDDMPIFVSARRDWLDELADVLGLSSMAPTGYDLVPRELTPHAPSPPSCSKDLMPVSCSFGGHSWCLSVAVGMAAAALEQILPSWVVCSGCLPEAGDLNPRLELGATAGLDRKIRLCAKRPPEYEAGSEPHWLCGADGQCAVHGPANRRALPGRVRLLLLARPTLLEKTSSYPWQTADGLPASMCQTLGLQPASREVDDLGRYGLNTVLAGLPAGAMLVLQVPTVWHALAVLNLRLRLFPPNICIDHKQVLGFILPPNGDTNPFRPDV